MSNSFNQKRIPFDSLAWGNRNKVVGVAQLKSILRETSSRIPRSVVYPCRESTSVRSPHPLTARSHQGVGRGIRYNHPLVLYNRTVNAKALINYLDLFYWIVTRVLPKISSVSDAHRERLTRQTPVYHLYHYKIYGQNYHEVDLLTN